MISSKQVAPNITYTQFIRPLSGDGQLAIINVVEINMGGSVEIQSYLGTPLDFGNELTNHLETVLSACKTEDAIVGINAGFFAKHSMTPIGLHIQDNELVTTPFLNRHCFLIDKTGKSYIARLSWSGKLFVLSSEISIPITAINRQPSNGNGDELIIFTPRFATKTPKSDNKNNIIEITARTKSKLIANSVLKCNISQIKMTSANVFNDDEIIISASGKYATILDQNIAIGQEISLALDIENLDKEQNINISSIKYGVAGAGCLVKKGNRVSNSWEEDNFDSNQSIQRNARTGIGIKKDGSVLLVTVDSPLLNFRAGLSIDEFSILMKDLGCFYALNLDGGKSTTLVINDSIVNALTGSYEPLVASMILVKSLKRNSPFLVSPNKPILVGKSFQFKVSATDTNASGIWGTESGLGFIDQKGLFTGLKPGKETVIHTINGWSARASVEIKSDINNEPNKTKTTPTVNNEKSLFTTKDSNIPVNQFKKSIIISKNKFSSTKDIKYVIIREYPDTLGYGGIQIRDFSINKSGNIEIKLQEKASLSKGTYLVLIVTNTKTIQDSTFTVE